MEIVDIGFLILILIFHVELLLVEVLSNGLATENAWQFEGSVLYHFSFVWVLTVHSLKPYLIQLHYIL